MTLPVTSPVPMVPTTIGATVSNGAVSAARIEDPLMAVARDLEAAFLSEMLKHAGFGAARDSFGGGIGEEQFSSLLRDEHARALAARGGIGLADSIFASLSRRAEGDA